MVRVPNVVVPVVMAAEHHSVVMMVVLGEQLPAFMMPQRLMVPEASAPAHDPLLVTSHAMALAMHNPVMGCMMARSVMRVGRSTRADIHPAVVGRALGHRRERRRRRGAARAGCDDRPVGAGLRRRSSRRG